MPDLQTRATEIRRIAVSLIYGAGSGHPGSCLSAADLLAVLGAHDSCLRWEEHAVLGTVRESANRLANCDAANARRAAAAGRRQAALMRVLMASQEWQGLPAQLRHVAELRVEYPYLSLTELAAVADPPLSRSALNHRLRRLVALAE